MESEICACEICNVRCKDCAGWQSQSWSNDSLSEARTARNLPEAPPVARCVSIQVVVSVVYNFQKYRDIL